jgi:BMFP domain-containing protein YqiC
VSVWERQIRNLGIVNRGQADALVAICARAVARENELLERIEELEKALQQIAIAPEEEDDATDPRPDPRTHPEYWNE